MENLAPQTWVVIITYVLLAAATFCYGPKSHKDRVLNVLYYVILGLVIAYFTQLLATKGWNMSAWVVALMPFIISLIVAIIALGTSMGIMMVTYAPKKFET